MIQVQCTNCQKIYKLDDRLAGKTAKCACGKLLVVPNLQPEHQETSDELSPTMAGVSSALQGLDANGLDIAGQMQREVKVIWVVGVALMLGAWVLYLSAAIFQFDLIEQKQKPDAFKQQIYLYLGLGVTVLGIPCLLLAVRGQKDLIRRGVTTFATVEKISSLGAQGKRPVTFAYTVEGVRYTSKQDVANSLAGQYDESTRVVVVYDPQRPSGARSSPDQSSAREQPEPLRHTRCPSNKPPSSR